MMTTVEPAFLEQAAVRLALVLPWVASKRLSVVGTASIPAVETFSVRSNFRMTRSPQTAKSPPRASPEVKIALVNQYFSDMFDRVACPPLDSIDVVSLRVDRPLDPFSVNDLRKWWGSRPPHFAIHPARQFQLLKHHAVAPAESLLLQHEKDATGKPVPGRAPMNWCFGSGVQDTTVLVGLQHPNYLGWHITAETVIADFMKVGDQLIVPIP